MPHDTEKKPDSAILEGVCTFHSETGTEGGHWAFQDSRHIHGEHWSYEGLHILKDGDFLTIYSRFYWIFFRRKVVKWTGKISLLYYPVFTESVNGMWIHAGQEGVDRETWAKYFLYEFPAKLTPLIRGPLAPRQNP